MPKIRVEIYGEGRMFKKKCKIRGNRVILQKETKKHPEYSAKFTKDSLVTYAKGIWPFKRLHQKLLLIHDAVTCISFDKTKANIPLCDREAISSFYNAETLKNAGTSKTKLDVPMFLYIMVFAVLALQVVAIMVGSGRVSFT